MHRRKKTYSVSLFVWRLPAASHRAPLCGEPLRPTLIHLARLHGGGLVQMCALASWRHAEIVGPFLNANDVAPLGSVPTRDVALHGEGAGNLCQWLCGLCPYLQLTKVTQI